MPIVEMDRDAWTAGVEAGLAGEHRPCPYRGTCEAMSFYAGRIQGEAWAQGYGNKHPLTGEPRNKESEEKTDGR